MDKKLFDLEEFEVKADGDTTYVLGYANTKGKPDSYGDIPVNYKGKPVYDLSRFKKNPVALLDHKNEVGSIFGVFIIGDGGTYEDEKGLKIKLRLMDNPQTPEAKHAVEAYKSGFARAFSIGGVWSFDDPDNKAHLTKAYIHEISGVAVGADQNSLSRTPKPKSLTTEETEGKKSRMVLEALVSEYRKTGAQEILSAIQIIKRGLV